MRAVIVPVVLALAACQTPCPAQSTETTVSTFACEDGSDLRVTFSAAQAMVEQEGYTTLTLPVRIASGGYRYANNGADLRGRLGEVRWSRPGAAETLCRASH